MEGHTFATPIYKPTSEANRKRLLDILDQHIPLLRDVGYIIDRPASILESANGSILELFEWKDEEAKRLAHADDKVRQLWEAMEEICEFPTLSDLPESTAPFPNFKVIKRL